MFFAVQQFVNNLKNINSINHIYINQQKKNALKITASKAAKLD